VLLFSHRVAKKSKMSDHAAEKASAKSVGTNMYELKTKETDDLVEAFIAQISDPNRQDDARTILAMFEQITQQPAKMWGPSIIGFGKYSYTYDSGHSGEMCKTGFSPRKRELVLYIVQGFDGFENLLAKLGKYKIGKSCLYIKRLSDVDINIVGQIIEKSYAHMCEKYGSD
jgi:hypothetical protein